MATIYYKQDKVILKTTDLSVIERLSHSHLVWIDLNHASPYDRNYVEAHLQISLQSRQQSEEIELSSRYIELGNTVVVNANFLVSEAGLYTNKVVSFILRDKLLISYRDADLKAFADTVRRFKIHPQPFGDGSYFLISILENKIDLDADLLESLSRSISEIGRALSVDKEMDEALLLKITALQETTMTIRENVIDNQRVISAMLRSERFPKDLNTKLRILIKDINSLIEYASFNFERLEYLQNTFLGLVNLEQNKIIKIFTVVTVIFMPPTLIASIYGMNFVHMPELQFVAGYPVALFLMVLSSGLTLLVFKKRRWL